MILIILRGESIHKRKKRIIAATIVLVIMVIIIFAINENLTVRYYEIDSNKISDKVRVAFVADLHSCYYGERQMELLDCIDEQQPDIIMLGGDIVDDRLPNENAVAVLKSLAEKYPCYYVSGNHEFWSGKIEEIKEMILGYGIIVLEGQSEAVTINGQPLTICGVDDAEIGKVNFKQQIIRAKSQIDPALFTIFMSHRPEYIDTYVQYEFDLILSGHAHGGQWRIPGILNGILAPNQGLFPKYAGGKYDFKQQTFIVSRGLARESTRIVRVFNPPELVIVDIVPAN